MLPSVDNLGHTISAKGLQPTKEKVRAVVIYDYVIVLY